MGLFFKRILYSIGDALASVFNVGIRLKYVILLLVLFCGGTVAYTYNKMLNNVGGNDSYDEAMTYIELKNLVTDRYIDEVDRSAMKHSAGAAIVSGIGDKWSYYMTPDEYKSYQLYSTNDYSDIGLTMTKADNGGFQIITVTPGTPAGNSGLASGMILTAIDGIDITTMDIDDVRVLFRSRLNQEYPVNCGKDVFTINCKSTYKSSVSYRLEKTEAGYIQIKDFEAGTGEDAIAAVEDLLNVGAVALCIDIRNNPGGLASEAAALLDYFLPNGPLFYQTTKNGGKEVTNSDAMSLSIPMVILVNTETYGEAELFAAVMQEEKWATVMGEATSGRTRTQETFELSDGSAVRLSTKSYVTANGVDISMAGGVIPETIVYNEDASTVGTTEGTLGDSNGTASSSDDTQLMAALKFLS
ncbi:MAG: S41 family peptidase [Eubacteriales bacterium]|nr:S41 family peptidase [Eubacteriales bacterium]